MQMIGEDVETDQSNYDNKFTSAFGFPKETTKAKIKDTLSEPIKEFISESPFLLWLPAIATVTVTPHPRAVNRAS